MDFNIPEDLKMVQTLARDFVKDQLLPLERAVLGRESDLEGAQRWLPAEKEAELTRLAQELGLWGFSIPDFLGGAGLGVLASCLVEEEMGKTVVPFNLGDISPLLFDCNEVQMQKYVKPLAEGKTSAYLALIEPGVNIDLPSLEMQARPENGDYILNGKKLVFAGSKPASFAIVFAVTDPGKGIREGVTAFLLNIDTPGLTLKKGRDYTGWKAQVREPVLLSLENCRVSAANIVGQEGKAFDLGKKWLPSRRIIRSARSVGAAARLLDVSVEHAKSWQTQGQVISNWPGIQAALAEMATEIKAARLMVYEAAWKADQGQDVHPEAAMVKVFSTGMLEKVANQAVLIRGGPVPAQELPLEVLCRSMLVSHIQERALRVQKAFIASQVIKMAP
jgi:alkylation response protein AidB-like acyl-CoA dehydrogenase